MASTVAYKIKNVETVVKGTDVQVRLFTLAPGETIPWHFHSDSSDHYFVLERLLSISTREPASTRTFSVGQTHKIAPRTPPPHRKWRRGGLPLFASTRCWRIRLECSGSTVHNKFGRLIRPCEV